MKNTNLILAKSKKTGFSLLELMVALAVFLTVGGAAVMLVQKHVPLFSSQQNQVGLNFAMRNAIAQMQVDVVNAGAGVKTGSNNSNNITPFGVMISPPPQNSVCTPPNYGVGCFDTLTLLQVDTSLPPTNPAPNGSGCNSQTSSTLFIQAADPTVPEATEAASLHNGDYLLVAGPDANGNFVMAPIVLTKDPQAAGNGIGNGNAVKLQHNPQGSAGSNVGLSLNANNKLGIPACNTAWVFKLLPPVTYYVDVATTPGNPTLRRQVGSTLPGDTLAEQIIGFKVGAIVWNAGVDSQYLFWQPPYTQNPYAPSDADDIRSVMISLIGRTAAGGPGAVPNAVDGGLYKIEGTSVVINPRNLSMND